MDERPKKRRGPLLWLAGRSRRWWVLIAIVSPVFYLLSFGPLIALNLKLGQPSWFQVPFNYFAAPLHWLENYLPEWVAELFRANVYLWCYIVGERPPH